MPVGDPNRNRIKFECFQVCLEKNDLIVHGST